MRRFKIKNKVNGLEFQVERETLEPMQPEWGRGAYTEQKLVTPEVRDEAGEIVTPAVYEEIQHAAEYEIQEEDMTAEIEAAAVIANRLREYPTALELIEAMCEKDMEGRPQKWEALKVKRAEVKAKYPKK